MIKEKKTARKSPTKKLKKDKKVEFITGKIEKMGTNSNGEEVYRRFTSETTFEVGRMINNEFVAVR